MYPVVRNRLIPAVTELSYLFHSKSFSTRVDGSHVKGFNRFPTCDLLNIDAVNGPKLYELDGKGRKAEKCQRTDSVTPSAEEEIRPAEEEESRFVSGYLLQNGVNMEKDSVLSSPVAGRTAFQDPEDSNSSSNEEEVSTRMRIAQEIKKSLNWMRWTEYSSYAKDLIKTNKWQSIQDEIISVATYNVLSQILLEKHRYLYRRHDMRSLQWETRSRVLMEEFADLNADILCLQEVDSSIVNSFYNCNLEKLGYQGLYKQRTNDKVDGCAIYFKKDKFNLVKHRTVEFFKQSVHLLNRDNIGIILKLNFKGKPEVEFIIATTHLLYNPKRGDIKLAQTQLILAEIEKMAYLGHNPLTQQSEYLPIIFTGDMNYSPDNGVYQLVTKSFLEYEGTSSEHLVPSMRGHILNKTLLPPRVGVTDSCQYLSSLSEREGSKAVNFSSGILDHHLNLESVYDHVKSNLPEATTNQDRWLTVDYIFYSQLWDNNLKLKMEGNLKLISRLTLPNSEEAEVYLRNIPNMACGSDHLPLMATFQVGPGNR